MSNPNPSTRFPKGNRIAAENGNTKGKRVRKSPLRKTLAKLQALEGKALENIKASVDGETIDKSMVDTSKWIVTNLMNLTKAASADEDTINGTRLMIEAAEREEEEKEAEEVTPSSRFSLHVLPTKSDL